MSWSKPETAQIRAALRRYAPQLAEERIEFLAEGWEFWAFTAGDFVLRFPKQERGYVWKLADRSSAESLATERALTPVLAPALSTSIAVSEIYGEDGPNGAPFAGHRYLPGEIVMYAARPPQTGFGAALSVFLRELKAFPAGRAVELGVPLFAGAALRADRVEHYEKVIRTAFPLLACEARSHVERVYEAYLNDAASFDFEPVLVHTDLAVNTLIDPVTGHLNGVIDFDDVAVSSPALDLWLPTYGFAQLGIAAQTAACLREAGVSAARLERSQAELAFLDLRYPLLGVLHGVMLGDETFVEESLSELNASLARNLRC